MKRTRLTVARAFWILVALQVVILVSMVGMQERSLAEGTIVRIKAQPVDPTDIARGSYVQLGYDTDDISTRGLDVHEGEDVLVGLREGAGGVHEFTKAYESPDDVPVDDLFIRAYADDREGVEIMSISTAYDSAENSRKAEEILADGAIVRVSLSETGNATLCGIEGLEDVTAETGCGLDG